MYASYAAIISIIVINSYFSCSCHEYGDFCKYEKISNLQILDIFKVKFLEKATFLFLIMFYKSIYSL